MPLKLLILGGTTEASALARAMAIEPRVDAVLSLAGVTRNPVLPPIMHRIGGFGGAAGLARYLTDNRIELLIDATHPFAAIMKCNAVEAARSAGVPLLAIHRPPWRPVAGDRWNSVADMKAAVAALGEAPQRVFLTIGQKELGVFRAAPQHHYVVRSVDPLDPADQPPALESITARGPFTVENDLKLLADKQIGVVVTKNSGGKATASKLAAARQLNLPVIIVERPETPAAEQVDNVAGCLAWLERHHDAATGARRGV